MCIICIMCLVLWRWIEISCLLRREKFSVFSAYCEIVCIVWDWWSVIKLNLFNKTIISQTRLRAYLLTNCLTNKLTNLHTYLLTYLHTYLLTYLLIPSRTVFLKNLTRLHPVKKFPAIYETRRFITSFTSARQLSLSWSSSIQSITPLPTKQNYICKFYKQFQVVTAVNKVVSLLCSWQPTFW